MRRALLSIACLLVPACQQADWRAAALADGEKQIVADLADPAAHFSDVQVVGDSATGQICGKVLSRDASTDTGLPARFVVYIDRTAGPWIEGQHGRYPVSDQRFDEAWRNDCVGEGWRPAA